MRPSRVYGWVIGILWSLLTGYSIFLVLWWYMGGDEPHVGWVVLGGISIFVYGWLVLWLIGWIFSNFIPDLLDRGWVKSDKDETD